MNIYCAGTIKVVSPRAQGWVIVSQAQREHWASPPSSLTLHIVSYATNLWSSKGLDPSLPVMGEQ